MSKRIKELAKEAGCILINDYYTKGNVMAFSDAQLEKFAELIVSEAPRQREWVNKDTGWVWKERC